MSYGEGGGTNYGLFAMPPPWLVNSDTVAKYVNKDAPNGGATKVGVVKPGKLLKVVAKGLGETGQQLDISAPSTGDICVSYGLGSVEFPGEVQMCGKFDGATCTHKSIAGNTGYKLVCKGNGAQWSCSGEDCYP